MPALKPDPSAPSPSVVLILALSLLPAGSTAGIPGDASIPDETMAVQEVFETPVSATAFSAGGGYFAVGSSDGGLAVFDLNLPKPLFVKKKAHKGGVLHLAFGGRDAVLACIGADGRLTLWDVPKGGMKAEAEIPGLCYLGRGRVGGGLHVLATDGKASTVKTGDGRVRDWFTASGGTSASRMWMLEDGLHALVARVDGTVQYVSTTLSRTIVEYPSAHGRVLDLRTAGQDERYGASVDEKGNVAFHDLTTGRERSILDLGMGPLSAARFADDMKSLVAASAGGQVHVFRLPSGEEQAQVREDAGIGSLAVSSDGLYLLLGLADGRCVLRHHPVAYLGFRRLFDRARQLEDRGAIESALQLYLRARNLCPGLEIDAKIEKMKTVRLERSKQMKERFKSAQEGVRPAKP